MTDQTPSPHDNLTDVNVRVEEAVGVIIMGFLFLIVLLALLRNQKRERKLLAEVADLRAKLQAQK